MGLFFQKPSPPPPKPDPAPLSTPAPDDVAEAIKGIAEMKQGKEITTKDGKITVRTK